MISRKTTISAAALLLASAGAAAAFPATATTDLNVRSGPGIGFGVIGHLAAGDTVDVVDTRGPWYQTAEGGWANGAFLEGEQTSYNYPVAFYYDETPFFFDNAGFFFFFDNEHRRHRVDRDFFRDRDERHFRFMNTRFQRDFENRRGFWAGERNVRRIEEGGMEGRPFRRGEAAIEQPLRTGRAAAEGPPREFRGGGPGPRIEGGRMGGGPGPRIEGGGRMGGGGGGGPLLMEGGRGGGRGGGGGGGHR